MLKKAAMTSLGFAFKSIPKIAWGTSKQNKTLLNKASSMPSEPLIGTKPK